MVLESIHSSTYFLGLLQLGNFVQIRDIHILRYVLLTPKLLKQLGYFDSILDNHCLPVSYKYESETERGIAFEVSEYDADQNLTD